MPSPTCVSAPGKVLLAGGYLVLHPAHSGLVVSTSSRFYTAVARGAGTRPGAAPHEICVRSPQFVRAQWRYAVSAPDARGGDATVRVEQITSLDGANAGKNKFVQLAIQRTLALAAEVTGSKDVARALADGLDITIVGDNDFYSQRAQLEQRGLPPTIASLAQIPPFVSTGVSIADVHKTGLGSSAALITSLVTALLIHLSVVQSTDFIDGDPAASEGRRLAHNLAQYVHCLAQGKVGSGFDVSAGVFGSQIYTRFDPAAISPLMEDPLPAGTQLMPVLSPFAQGWNYGVRAFQLPPFTRLVLADVDAGSDTPSFVGRVLKWRKDNSVEADALWADLSRKNDALADGLLGLSKLHGENESEYGKTVKYISSMQAEQWLANPNVSAMAKQILQGFTTVHLIGEAIRSDMRQMGQKAGVPIEPQEQTDLLDASTSAAGVIAGGVPGAGGYDAIWLLVCDPPNCPGDEQPLSRVQAIWESWTGLNVTPLSATESVARGCRLEDVDEIQGLRGVLTQQ